MPRPRRRDRQHDLDAADAAIGAAGEEGAAAVPAARRPHHEEPLMARTITLATERDYQNTILGAAKVLGWRTAHFRPARTAHGWRTAVAGDGAGFPDMVLIHPKAAHVWFVELKRDDARRLRPEQDQWRLDLISAGAIHHVVWVPSQLSEFIESLQIAARVPRPVVTS